MQESLHPNAMAYGELRIGRVFPKLIATTSVPDLFRDHQGFVHPHHRQLPGDWQFEHPFERNLILNEWAAILGELLRGAPDRKPYQFGAMYIEFENNGGAAVSTPTPLRTEASSYYADLVSDSTRDYLRVPVTAVTLTSTDENFPRGNRLTAYAQTDGTVGVHGKPFSPASQSRVYGAALVSTPDFGDASQDLIWSRMYYTDTSRQLIALASSQVGLAWRTNLL
jgi:hypothetical protein